MAGLYQRGVAPNFSTPAMQVAASQGAAGGIPRGGAAAVPQQQDNGINASQLGGLLGMMNQQQAGQGGGVADIAQMAGNGAQSAVTAANSFGPGIVSSGPAALQNIGNMANSGAQAALAQSPGLMDSIKNGFSGLLGMFGGGAG